MFQRFAYIEGLAGRMIKTTLPAALQGGEGEGDVRQKPEGAPAGGVEKFIQIFLVELPKMGLHLTAISPEQLRQVVADRFESAPEFVERVATMMERGIEVLPKFPITAAHLRARLGRAKVLDEAVVIVQDFLQLLQQSAHLEWSDLLKMCDYVMNDVEAQIERPALGGDLRRQLAALSASPAETWRTWLQGRKKTQAKNDSIRDEARDGMEAQLKAALQRAEAAEARLRQLGAASPTTDTGPALPASPERRRNRT